MSNFYWKEYIDLSIWLQDELKKVSGVLFASQAAKRCAISRAYYGAFCLARNFLIEKNEIKKDLAQSSAAHREVPLIFKRLSLKDAGKVYLNLEALKIMRKGADYRDDYTEWTREEIDNDLDKSIRYSGEIRDILG